jgi:uncharacterized protein (PEP-CTERM system associated)
MPPCLPERPLPLRWLVVAAALGGSGALALAQDGGSTAASTGRVQSLSFGIGASESLLASVRPGGSRVDEAVTQINPSVAWSSYSGRVRGSVNYGASLRHYAGDNKARTDKTTVDNSLSANLNAELVDNRAFLDVNASVGQQSISGLDVPSGSNLSQTGGNRSEVTISPYTKGSLAGLASYELRYSYSASDGSDDAFARRNGQSLSLSLRSQGSGLLGWGLAASTSGSDLGGRGSNRGERINGDISIKPDLDWRFGLSAGQERTNVGTLAPRTYDNWGVSGTWTPSPRTRVEVGADRRYYGDSHRVSVEYRSPRTVWRYSDVQDVNNGNQQGGVGQPVTLFQLFFAQFASIQPDPALREQLVLQYLASLGRNPNEVLFLDVVNRGTTVQRRRDLSAAWLGLRATVTVQAYSNSNRLLDGPNTGTAAGGGGSQNQTGISLSGSYRLTPETSLSVGGSLSRSPVAGGLRAEAKTVSLGWSTQLGRRVSASVSGRYSVLNGGVDPYREASLTASLSLRF